MAHELANRRNDLFGGFNDFFDDDHFFNNLGRMYYGLAEQNDLKTDIKETDHDYNVTVEVPGLDKKDINVRYDNDILTISGKKDSFTDEADKDGNTLMSERNYGSFTRQYRIPRVNADDIKGKYENGVLKITLPKEKKEVPADHRVEIE
ncbi:Hsp20/alpha crystallin family protein [Lapidilactobacillus wuchangensis]|uniref:Hsp20/alpha crystallin family protein n=1 Tax=Lapidilactobacillus wuchangensis TaxID=2486001 RepID=UPI000F7925F0|nr:Hsp20/alpha crystallin family protein [Lapidilactobacillus wuchangensis]